MITPRRQRPSATAHRAALAGAIALALHTTPLRSEPYALCPPPQVPAPVDAASGTDRTRIRADRLEATADTRAVFIGHVEAVRGEARLTGTHATYEQQADILHMTGDVQLRTPELAVSGAEARLYRGSERGEIKDAWFFHEPLHAFGSAERIEFVDPEHTRFEEARYSTCNPGVNGWELRADRIELDEATNTGEVYHTTVHFKGVPLAYLPYLNFPLRGRKTGLLAPSFGTSEEDGADFSQPWYWNIAANRDATLTPRYMSKRGPMLMSEYRYLYARSAGEVRYDVMPDDDTYGDGRSFFEFQHAHRFAPGWLADLAYREVSDDDYFIDFGRGLSTTSETHLERHLVVDYWGSEWAFLGRIEEYQTLDAAEPYRRLPQLHLRSLQPQRLGKPHYALNAEFTYFEHPEDQPVGSRLDLTPEVALPLGGPAWFLTPGVALRHTEYALANSADERISRTLPVTSLDGGLFFERELELAGHALLQTLEPRLYYLYVPYEDQDAIPLFDTGDYTFSFNSLFRRDRFSGADRVGDANQLTAAVTTRFLDLADGHELFSASAGQIHYFDERKVTLEAGAPPDATGRSDYVAELSAYPGDALNMAATVQWDPHAARDEQFTTRVEYTPDERRRLYFSYRFERDALRQTDVAAFWPLSPRWQLLARVNRDLVLDRNLDAALGLEYESCCWAVRVLWRETRTAGADEADRSVYVTLAFKGLTQIGQPLETELERDILGYSTNRFGAP